MDRQPANSVGEAVQAVPNAPGAPEFDATAPLPGEEGYDAVLAEQKRLEALDAIRDENGGAPATVAQDPPPDPGRPPDFFLVPSSLVWEILGLLSEHPYGEVAELIDVFKQSPAISSERAREMVVAEAADVDVAGPGE